MYKRKQLLAYYYRSLENYKCLDTSFIPMKNKIDNGMIISVVARPGWGKTFFKDMFAKDLYYNNEACNTWVDFQLEMSEFEVIKRELLANGIDFKDKEKVAEYFSKTKNENWTTIFSIERLTDINDICDELIDFGNGNRPIVTLDHALAASRNGEMMSWLFSELVKLKKKGAVVIVLSQLSRNVMNTERREEASENNEIRDMDIYNSDSLLQYSDIVLCLDRPYYRGIKSYHKAAIPIYQESCIFHFLKDRTGDTRMFKYIFNDFKFEYIGKLHRYDASKHDLSEDLYNLQYRLKSYLDEGGVVQTNATDEEDDSLPV